MINLVHRPLNAAFGLIAFLSCIAPGAAAQQMAGMPHASASASASPGPSTTASSATVQFYRSKNELVMDIGPIDLPANAMHDMIRQPPVVARVLGVDGWMHGYRLEITDSAGRAVPQRVLHHIEITDPQKRELFSHIMLRVGASGAETSPIALPRWLGYRVLPTDTVLVSLMVHNPTDTSYYGVHVRLRAPFTSSASWVPTLSVYPFWLAVLPPAGGHSFDVPPGRSEFHWEGSPAISGRVLGMEGHLHKYGVLLQLEDRTSHRVLWTSRPDTDATGEIKSMPLANFLWRFGLPLRPDHVYRLTAVYDNPTDSTIVDGGMGTLGGVIHPTQAWPGVDRSNPDYQFDVKYTWRLIRAPNDAPMRMRP